MRRMPILLLALVACQRDAAPNLELPQPEPLELGAPPGAAQPHLSASADYAYLSWTEPADSGHALRFAAWDGSAWSAPRTIAAGRHWFVNWADFPSIEPVGGSVLIAHWLQRSGPGTYSYDVMMTQSADDGASWSEPFRPHDDGTLTEHGFVSIFPLGAGAGAVWLDGRQFADAHGHSAGNEMTLRFAAIAGDGALSQEMELDRRACDCCQTAAAVTSRGPVVAWRDRSPDEVRDIVVSRLVDGAWTEPRVLHADNWVIPGCPVNGPQADAAGDNVAIAWFAAPADSPRVQVAFSADAGETFGAPVRVDDGNAIGRVDVLLLDDRRALVVWLESAGAGAEVRGRLVSADGRLGAARVFAAVTAGRASGFPRMARLRDQIVLAWNEAGEAGQPAHIRAARLTLR
ncbi:MAG TPA: sialidase family protein [Gammaproteobacteria bacterium]|nr:sialidase family protein [Gammaproteobacteria bacterium]